MAKTTYTSVKVNDFIRETVSNPQKIADSFELVRILEEISGEKAVMWGPSIIGFGNYHYKYKSGHEGDAPVLGFSPRKAAFSLYIYSHTERSKSLLPGLGKFKMAKACIYVNKLADINMDIFSELCLESIRYIIEHHECSCRNKI